VIDPFTAKPAVDGSTGQPLLQVPLSSKSIWDQALLRAGRQPQFTLNRFNYDAMADILLPRAVGYAAGFLDTFFRGSVGGAFEQQNLTISGSTEVMDGTFRVLYDTDDGTRRELASWSLRIEPDSSSPPLPTPTLPADAAPGMPCWLIFRGQLGLEPDAVAGSRIACPNTTPEPSPPSGGPWVVYYCATFISSQNYLYATTDPPLDGLAPDNLFVYFQVSTNTSFNCGIKAIHVATPPPNARTEHPL
jgi:hypothetical protein